ncbi:MAG: hypothetical protein Q7R81_01280 [Candidatus Peregrinibacteria bacterium]|nr:hypothetical protein [Candidatus Peregrinibacteria bacterium]
MPFHPGSKEYTDEQQETLRARSVAMEPLVQQAAAKFFQALAREGSALPDLSPEQLKQMRIPIEVSDIARYDASLSRVVSLAHEQQRRFSPWEWNWQRCNPELESVVSPYNAKITRADDARIRAIQDELALNPDEMQLSPLEQERLLFSVSGKMSWMNYEHFAAPHFFVPVDPSLETGSRMFNVVSPVPVRRTVNVGIGGDYEEIPVSVPLQGMKSYDITHPAPTLGQEVSKQILVKDEDQDAFLSLFNRTIPLLAKWQSEPIRDIPTFMHNLHEMLIMLMRGDQALHLAWRERGMMKMPAIPTQIDNRTRNIPITYPEANAYALRTDLLKEDSPISEVEKSA